MDAERWFQRRFLWLLVALLGVTVFFSVRAGRVEKTGGKPAAEDDGKWARKDFPYQFVTAPGGLPLEVRMSNGERAAMRYPFTVGDSGYYWDAYGCANPECAYRKENGAPLLFPLVNEDLRAWADAGYPEPQPRLASGGMLVMMPKCPTCGSSWVTPYNTPEGKGKLERFRSVYVAKFK